MENAETTTRRFRLPNTLAVWFTGVVAVIGLLSIPFVTNGGPDFPSICFVSCTLLLGSMIAVWCAVLGGWKAYLVGVVAIVIDGLSLNVIGGPDWWPTLLPLAIALPCCMTLELIKVMFGKFSKISASGEEFQEGLQFKLTHLFITTTVIAVVCGIGQAVAPFVSFEQPSYRILTMLGTIALVLASNTLLCVWAILGKAMLWRLSIAIPVAIGLVALGGYVMQDLTWIWPLIFGICFLATAILLWMLRFEGYRFVRKAIAVD